MASNPLLAYYSLKKNNVVHEQYFLLVYSFSLTFSLETSLVLSQSLYKSPINHTCLPTTNTEKSVFTYLLTVGSNASVLSLSTVLLLVYVS